MTRTIKLPLGLLALAAIRVYYRGVWVELAQVLLAGAADDMQPMASCGERGADAGREHGARNPRNEAVLVRR